MEKQRPFVLNLLVHGFTVIHIFFLEQKLFWYFPRSKYDNIVYALQPIRTWNGYYAYQCICFTHNLRSRTILYFISQQYVLNLTTDDLNLIRFNRKISDRCLNSTCGLFSVSMLHKPEIVMKYKFWIFDL